MQSVSSNAVARALEYSEYEDTTNTITIKKWGRFVWVSKGGYITGGTNPHTINNAIPSQYLPTTEVRTTWINNTSDKPMGQAIIRTDGRMQIYAGWETSFSNVPAICQFCYIV